VRPQWTWDKHPNCLAVHDLTYHRLGDRDENQFYNVQILGEGAFRESYLFEPITATNAAPFVVKSQRYHRDLNVRDLHQIDTEAVILEKLSSSPLTSNIYGYCGSTIMVERGHEIEETVMPRFSQGRLAKYPHGRIAQSELDKLQKEDVHPMNAIAIEQKLDMAIAMAESLAEVHGFEGGVMINDDIDFSQWLWGDDGRLVLNDMNNAM